MKDGEIRGGARGLQVQILPEGVRFEDRVESAYEREGEAGNVSCEVEEEEVVEVLSGLEAGVSRRVEQARGRRGVYVREEICW